MECYVISYHRMPLADSALQLCYSMMIGLIALVAAYLIVCFSLCGLMNSYYWMIAVVFHSTAEFKYNRTGLYIVPWFVSSTGA